MNLADFEGRTPISHGVGRIEHIKYLVEECGADLNIPDNDGHRPLWYAKKNSSDNPSPGKIDIVKELVSLGARE